MRYEGQELIGFDVSMVITSCKRHDLLYKTLQSFIECNTYPIKEIIIVEDSDYEIKTDVIKSILLASKLIDYTGCELVYILNGCNLGQMKSIDKAYSLVKSQFIFHCEDDWKFHKQGFIERSFDILKLDEKIFTVWLRAYSDLCGHKISEAVNKSKVAYRCIAPMGIWSGFTLNPGLRRTKDCLLLHPYALQKHVDSNLKNRDTVTESDLSILYGELGFRAVVTTESDGFLHHIGEGYHIANVWENSTVVRIKNVIKKIITVIK
jgi:hypothetical protein